MEAEQPRSLWHADSLVGRQPKAARQSCLTEQAGAAKPPTCRSAASGRAPYGQPFQGPIRKLLILNTFFLKNNLYYNL